MAANARQTVAPVIQDMLTNGHQYQLLQAYQLLMMAGAISDDPTALAQPVRIDMRPSLRMDSARSVIERIVQVADQHFCIELNILNLYGRNSVLPAYISEYLLQAEQQESPQARLFLDLINQRIYELQLEILQRSLLVIEASKDSESNPRMAYFEQLLAISGLGGIEFSDPQLQQNRLRYFKLFASPFRSAAGLAALVSDYLDQIPVQDEQCSIRNVHLPKSAQLELGQQKKALGTGTLLGHQLQERNGAFTLVIGPLSFNKFDQLLKNHQQWQTLRQLIRLYLRQPLQCELVFQLQCNEQDNTQTASQGWGQLGRNAWLIQPNFSPGNHHAYQLQARIALD
ncbi:Type VI secretion, VasB, ImpH, VC_A0111 [Oceanospirillum multiglobuliferum]|uniref:Type VI secretion protein n=1 Tax=Oceanospirillum multiglobuliferum TaxID=64969 RepID=A0A1T4MT28_9GAMM|nr:type VI secretion system baseplate subunit TssG [Oceanospirillum multiglobuliferum]OPX56895.1 hypothetical protein BTE48_00210 [Oceanospirillum multiglobuliferum]SJZ70260.1 Type VI secretion, VasB, ImpH, VC_A0111 [Oceanospirillum multiglobuliferum]